MFECHELNVIVYSRVVVERNAKHDKHISGKLIKMMFANKWNPVLLE